MGGLHPVWLHCETSVVRDGDGPASIGHQEGGQADCDCGC